MPISDSAATELAQLLGSGTAGELIPELVRQGLQALIEAHVVATASPLGKRLLANWGESVTRFVRIVPTPVAEAERALDPVEAVPA